MATACTESAAFVTRVNAAPVMAVQASTPVSDSYSATSSVGEVPALAFAQLRIATTWPWRPAMWTTAPSISPAFGCEDKVAGVYDRSPRLTERRKMMQAWSDYLDTLRAEALK